MMLNPRYILCGLALSMATVFSWGAGIPAPEAASLMDEYAVARWQVEEGLPSDAVLALAFTTDGFLWCLTERQLSRFDGVRFESRDWPTRLDPGGWAGLEETAGSALWVYGGSGACNLSSRFAGRSVWAGTTIPLRTSVQKVVRGTDNILWAVVSNGLYRVNGRQTQFHQLPGPSGAKVNAAEAGADGVLWLASGQSILRFSKGNFEVEQVPPSGEIQHLSDGRDGVVWAATATGLLCRVEGRWQA
ncbi:MAG: hypothetical protein WCO77_11915, partial [bacterium]